MNTNNKNDGSAIGQLAAMLRNPAAAAAVVPAEHAAAARAVNGIMALAFPGTATATQDVTSKGAGENQAGAARDPGGGPVRQSEALLNCSCAACGRRTGEVADRSYYDPAHSNHFCRECAVQRWPEHVAKCDRSWDRPAAARAPAGRSGTSGSHGQGLPALAGLSF